MALPLGTITTLLIKLAPMLMASDTVIKSIKDLIISIPKKNKDTSQTPTNNVNLSELENRVSLVEKGMDLTAKLSEETTEQLRIIQSLFENIKKSLRILSFAIYCIGLIALIAIVLAVIK